MKYDNRVSTRTDYPIYVPVVVENNVSRTKGIILIDKSDGPRMFRFIVPETGEQVTRPLYINDHVKTLDGTWDSYDAEEYNVFK